MYTNVDPPKFGRGRPDGIAKVIEDPHCRVCGQGGVQAAHLWPRSLGARGYDNEDIIVPLCQSCHSLFDAGKLELLPHLTNAEQAAVVRYAGIPRALKRLTIVRKPVS